MKRTTNGRDAAALGATSGVTLIEMVVAIAVITIGFAMLFGSLTSIVAANKITGNRQVALTQLSTVVEELQDASFDELTAYIPPNLTGLGNDVQINVRCVDANGAMQAIPIADANVIANLPNPLTVQVTVTWKEGPGQFLNKQTSIMVRR